MKKDVIKVGFVGAGARGPLLLRQMVNMSDVEVAAVCDKYEDRTQNMKEIVEQAGRPAPFTTQDYKEMIARGGLDAVVIATDWNLHIPIAIEFMEAGIRVGMEVGGCDSLEECWEMVRTYRRTGVELMMLENCCYGKEEMMVLNMVKEGFFGDVVHMTGSYSHYLADQIVAGKEKRHYRLRNYMNRNCENYPTHAFGPLCKLININHGNRLISLTSTASKAAGLKAYMKDHEIENKELLDKEFNQGDIVTTTIKCAHGETITLMLDTTLPCYGTRSQMICGTKARYYEVNRSVYDTAKHTKEEFWRPQWGNLDDYNDKYMHPLWKEYEEVGVRAGHGGMDWLVLRAFVESVKNQTKPPIDVYDAAAWMCITPLSEASIAKGGMPVEIPDFTYGQWIEDPNPVPHKYSLDVVCEDKTVPIVPEEA